MGTVFRRKIYDALLRWKMEDDGSSALLLEGARRVGKSTIVRHFAENEYRSHVLIDFSRASKDILELFDEGLGPGCDDFFKKLHRITKVTLYHRESVIIFDEVQFCPKARQMIKHLVADGRYDYIETGSLISIKRNVADILIPSEEQKEILYPMDFEEFLWAMGDDATVPFIRDFFDRREPIGNSAHRSLMKRFREYMIVGGMPQAVAAYARTLDFDRAEAVKRRIIDLYIDDTVKIPYDGGTNAGRIFKEIPSMLSSHNKCFSPGTIEKDRRTRDFEHGLDWLDKSRTVLLCHRCTDPSPAMMLDIDHSKFKCYISDIGLLVTLSISAKRGDKGYVLDSLMNGKLSINEGMYFENAVAQELRSKGHELLFSSFSEGRMSYEVDFILWGGRKVRPVEVKPSLSKRHASLDRYIERHGRMLGERFVIHDKDLRVEGGITYIPIYMTMFL